MQTHAEEKKRKKERKKKTLKVHLCIWATRKFTAFLRHSALISVLYSTEFYSFHNFIFFCSK
jgi:hypothetical protein